MTMTMMCLQISPITAVNTVELIEGWTKQKTYDIFYKHKDMQICHNLSIVKLHQIIIHIYTGYKNNVHKVQFDCFNWYFKKEQISLCASITRDPMKICLLARKERHSLCVWQMSIVGLVSLNTHTHTLELLVQVASTCFQQVNHTDNLQPAEKPLMETLDI